MKITDFVYVLDCTSYSNAYLITAPDLILVDTCIPGKSKQILSEIRSLGFDPAQMKHIFLTHHDGDHTGSAAALEEATGAKVWASEIDIPYITREKKPTGLKNFVSAVMKVRQPSAIHPYPPDGQMGEVKIISTPGHTPGHVCLLYRDVLFAGDLVLSGRGKIRPSLPIMTWDMPAVMESIEKVRPYSFKWICPAHGRPVERDDSLLK